MLQITPEYYQITNNIEKSYRYRTIPKRSGGQRLLQIPDLRLRKIQRTILDETVMFFPVHSAATAFLQGSSIVCHAKYHTDYPVVVNLDLADFFPTVTYSRVLAMFRKNTKFSLKICVLLANLCCLDGMLPQGAPTSPALANAAFYPVDCVIDRYCQRKDIQYTRYADDMTFSGDFEASCLIAFVKRTLSEEYRHKIRQFPDTDKKPFTINPSKIHVSKSGSRQMATGIVVNKKLQTAKEYRRRIRQEIHYIKQYGLEEHMSRIGCQAGAEEKYLQSLSGRIAHVLFVNNQDKEFINYKYMISKLMKGKQA